MTSAATMAPPREPEMASTSTDGEVAPRAGWKGAAAAWTLLSLLAADVEPILVKLGYQAHATPLQFLALKTVLAAILIQPLTRRWRPLPMREVARIASVSVLLLVTNGCMLAGLAHATVVTALTIVTSTPALVALVNRARGREVQGTRFWLGFILCFGGVVTTIDVAGSGGMSSSGLGLLFLFGAVISSTVYRVRMEDLTARYEPLLVSTWMFVINGTLVAVFLLPWIWPVPPQALGIGLWIGFAGAVANVAFVAALHLIGATRISIINMLQRPLIIITAAIVLHEPLTVVQLAGIAAVVVGVQLAKVQRK